MLKEILENGNIPFTDLLPDQELIMPIALKLGYEITILNKEYRGTEKVVDENGVEIKDEKGEFRTNQAIGRMEENPETPKQFINRVLMDNTWEIVKPIIKDIMLAEQMQAMRLAEALIDAQLDTTKSTI